MYVENSWMIKVKNLSLSRMLGLSEIREIDLKFKINKGVNRTTEAQLFTPLSLINYFLIKI